MLEELVIESFDGRSYFDSPDVVDVESTNAGVHVESPHDPYQKRICLVCFDSPDMQNYEITGKVERSRGLKTH